MSPIIQNNANIHNQDSFSGTLAKVIDDVLCKTRYIALDCNHLLARFQPICQKLSGVEYLDSQLL